MQICCYMLLIAVILNGAARLMLLMIRSKRWEVEKPVLYVFNKMDKLSAQELEQLEKEIVDYQPHVLIHTKSKDGVKELVDYLACIKQDI